MTESVAVDVPTTADRWLVWREPPRSDHRRRAAAKEVGAGRDRSTERSVSAEPAPTSKHPMPTFGEYQGAREQGPQTCIRDTAVFQQCVREFGSSPGPGARRKATEAPYRSRVQRDSDLPLRSRLKTYVSE
jgi:hypothetical protein